MKYTEAILELEKFANEPLDTNNLNLAKVMELRQAARVVVNTANSRSTSTIVFEIEPGKKATMHTTRQPRKESRKVQMVDMIREAREAGLSEHVLYKEFKLSGWDMRREIANSYGVVTATVDSKNNYTFYYLADSTMLFAEKYDGKVPSGHIKIGW